MQSRGGVDGASSADVGVSQKISPVEGVGADGNEDSDDDAPPEVFTSKPPPPALVDHASSDEDIPDQTVEVGVAETPSAHRSTMTQAVKPVNKARPPQPKKAPYNPFASRPTLLRNVSCLLLSFFCTADL